jgi:hypothetical protein
MPPYQAFGRMAIIVYAPRHVDVLPNLRQYTHMPVQNKSSVAFQQGISASKQPHTTVSLAVKLAPASLAAKRRCVVVNNR